MILVPSEITTEQLEHALAKPFIPDNTVLITNAGFASDSTSAGEPRQTFSVLVECDWFDRVKQQAAVLYDQLINRCWQDGEPLPFDMIRLDAYITAAGDMQILEINTRNVGMHEFTEWMDMHVAQTLGIAKNYSLNGHFVSNQKMLHQHVCGTDLDLLYITGNAIPDWLYLEQLQQQYPSVQHITDKAEIRAVDEGILYADKTYKTVISKYTTGLDAILKPLNESRTIRVLQPQWMRPFGKKDFLPLLESSTIPRTTIFSSDNSDDYIQNQQEYVIKIINGGNSSNVYLGAKCSVEEWQEVITRATARPDKWVIQTYIEPTIYKVLPHALPAKNAQLQFGIFLLPKQHNPHEFDIDVCIKGYVGQDKSIIFDPSGYMPEIWFGNLLVRT